MWTGTASEGTKTAENCSDWGSASGTGTEGDTGSASAWTNDSSSGDCSDPARLYCFESLPYKRVFVTGTAYTGNLGGLAGADEKCQTRANTAQLGGTWRAWLSTSTTNAMDRIPDAEYRLLDLSTVVATNKANLLDGMLDNHIRLDELGVLRATFVWTGTENDGTGVGSYCSDWSAETESVPIGRSDQLDMWSNAGTIAACTNALRLYCFEQ